MVKQPSIRKLVNRTQLAPHQHAVGVDTFPKLNLEAVAAQLELEAHGSERGALEEPPVASQEHDEIEERIIDYIRAKRAEAIGAYEESRATYLRWLSSLGLQTVVSDIQDEAKVACSKMDAAIEKARSVRLDLVERIEAAQRELNAFQVRHGLSRPARYPVGQGAKVLRWALIGAMVLIEGLLNGYFLGQGSAFGLLGGWTEALVIAGVNVAGGLFAGRVLARHVAHREPLIRYGALALLVLAWAPLFFFGNLLVAHYRDALELVVDDAGAAALASFARDKWVLASFHSWLLLAVGFGFAVLAAADGYSMDDPYPGYGGAARRLQELKDEFATEREGLYDEVTEIYQSAIEAMSDKAHGLAKRLVESEETRAAMDALHASLIGHLRYLEDSANRLLQVYRDANRKARPSKAVPASFKRKWRIDSAPVVHGVPKEFAREHLERLTVEARRRKQQGEAKLDAARATVGELFPALQSAAA